MASPDPKAIGIGGKVGKRNAPSILNRGLGKHFFWDGRVTTLEQQALEPISNPDELGSEVDKVIEALQKVLARVVTNPITGWPKSPSRISCSNPSAK